MHKTAEITKAFAYRLFRKCFHQNDTKRNEIVCWENTWRRTSRIQARKMHSWLMWHRSGKSIIQNNHKSSLTSDLNQPFDNIYGTMEWYRSNWSASAGHISKAIKCLKSRLKDHRKRSHESRSTKWIGYVLSPFQFNPVLEAVMALGLNNTEAGIKLNGELMNNLQFVDDIALLTKSISKLQGITTQQSRTV